MHHGSFQIPLSFAQWCACHHGLFRAQTFETPATFHNSTEQKAIGHWTVQWFIQANGQTVPRLLSTNIDAILFQFDSKCTSSPGIELPHMLQESQISNADMILL